jgi:hypothetical protein
MIGAVSASQACYATGVRHGHGPAGTGGRQLDTSTTVSTGSAPPRTRISRTG